MYLLCSLSEETVGDCNAVTEISVTLLSSAILNKKINHNFLFGDTRKYTKREYAHFSNSCPGGTVVNAHQLQSVAFILGLIQRRWILGQKLHRV
jgi:hypothetical protein